MLVINGVSYGRYEVDVCNGIHGNRSYNIRLYGKSVSQEIEILANSRRGIPVQIYDRSFVGEIIKMEYQMESSGITVDIEIIEMRAAVPRMIDCEIKIDLNKEDNKMLEIKDATLINDQNAEHFGIDRIIELISEEETFIEELSAVKSESKAITRIKEQHESNIKKLVEILDSRE